MKRLFDGQSQHFHKNRQDRMLLPHRELSGLLFTINPRQEERAKREIVQFLEPIVADIKKEYKQMFVKEQSTFPEKGDEHLEITQSSNIDKCHYTENLSPNAHFNDNVIELEDNESFSTYKSTSSMLAHELNAASSNGDKHKSNSFNAGTQNYKRPRIYAVNNIVYINDNNSKENSVDDDSNDETKHCTQEVKVDKSLRSAVHMKEKCELANERCKENESWLRIRETNCKGYLFVQIPVISREDDCVVICNHALSVESKPSTLRSDETHCHGQSFCKHEMPLATTSTSSSAIEQNSSYSLVHCVKSGNSRNTNYVIDDGAISIDANDDTNKDNSKYPSLVPHSIVINPLVSITVERLFDNLLANPRPAFRSCFRLYPAELCCCPTLSEMENALRTLLHVHFPPKKTSSSNINITNCTNNVDNVFTTNNETNAIDHNISNQGNNDRFTSNDSNNSTCTLQAKLTNEQALQESNLYLPHLPSHRKHAHKSLHTIALHVNVKNNTKVEQEKSWLTSQLLQRIPANRFIVISPQHMSQKKASSTPLIEAVITVNVLHSTCCIGIQYDFDNRHKYNVHDIASSSLELQSESTFTSRVHVQQQQQHQV